MAGMDGAKTFDVDGEVYDSFMGRYSFPLADCFADAAGIERGQTAVDVGCGTGALTRVLHERLGSRAVAACDPSPAFVRACAARHPGVCVKPGRAESIPFESDRFDHGMAQLVLHFVTEPEQAVGEIARVVRPGGAVSACVWDFDGGMEMLRAFWDAALTVDPDAPDEAQAMRFGRAGEIAQLLVAAGLHDVEESLLSVSCAYSSFEELWDGFLGGVGPAGAYCVALAEDDRRRLRDALYRRIGSPPGEFVLGAEARCSVGRVPRT